MKLVALNSLYEKSDKASLKKQKRLIEIANLDPAANLALRVGSLDGLWEYEINLVKNMNHEGLFANEGKLPVESCLGDEVACTEPSCESDAVANYLLLCSSTLELLMNSESILTSVFSSAIRVMQNGEVEEIFPKFGGGYSQRIFVWCNPEKNSNKLDIDDYASVPCNPAHMTLFVDLQSSNYKSELIGLLPDLVKYPKFIQNKISKIPEQYTNMPERLNCLIEAYEKYWKNLKPNSSVKESIIDADVKKFLDASFASASEPYNKNRDSDNKLVPGKKMVAFAAKTIKPEFIKRSLNRTEKSISDGVPTKFWILLCAAQYFWKNVDRGDIDSHPEGKHIEKVLTCFGNEYPFKHDKMYAGEWENTTPYQDAIEDFQRFISQFPEIKYFRDVSFASDYKYAASIIRPFWAKSKNKGGGRYEYGEAKSKGRENYIRVRKEK
ncbi:hypothetical protein L0668_10375 [Paraglaciecola aquimarina]|uniref:Uncharacterized protein n=1 Tax=Paraglaciecola algarum TaxID=3050085 RepID=A0ABS9D7Z9_9ALTE|nr:hypothetical protein [Paraglaciecola sp. G1-23]MCF2948512.1 hypothetical protein [Paraglaciecola sp. G1-23]